MRTRWDTLLDAWFPHCIHRLTYCDEMLTRPCGVVVSGEDLLFLLFTTWALANPLPTSPLIMIQETAADVAARRDLPLITPIVAASFTEAELRARVGDSLDQDYSAEDIRGDTATLVVMGFATPDIDLRQTYLDIFAEQIGGFYDPEDQQLVLVQREEGDPNVELVVVEHELVHALQDQNFGLAALDEFAFDNGDVETALRSLVEGDASFFNVLTMAGDFAGNISGMPLGNGGALPPAYPGTALASAPDLLARSLLFPYIQGSAFVQAVHATDGYRAVNTAYRSRPPLSTEQILHPARYLSVAPDWPIALTLASAKPLLVEGTEKVDDDTLGELGVLSWLEGVGGQDVVGTPLGWGGDRYATYIQPDGSILFTWLTTWDTPDDAQRFEICARGALESLPGDAWKRDGWLRTRSGQQANVRREGVDVTVILGASRSLSRALDSQLRNDAVRDIFSSADVFTPPQK